MKAAISMKQVFHSKTTRLEVRKSVHLCSRYMYFFLISYGILLIIATLKMYPASQPQVGNHWSMDVTNKSNTFER